ncbi:MAG: hypothetical protein ACI4J6_00065 [Oscillospiraceae bacterium]
MGILQAVFGSREFDLNDDVLIEFNSYFDENNMEYNRFSLDREDIPALRKFVEQIEYFDTHSKIYVCTYGYEITNNKEEKLSYADSLWIDTILPISKIKEIIEECNVVEASDISFVGDCNEIGKGKIWLITQTEQGPEILELIDHKKIKHMILLYWD